MFHVRAINLKKHGPLYRFYTINRFGPPNMKENVRRGMVLSTISSVLLLVGSILTWLVFTEVFDSKLPIMGPLVLAVGLLLLILAIRQFFVVWRLKKKAAAEKKKEETRADQGEEVEESPDHANALEMETWEPGMVGNSAFVQYSLPIQSCDPSAVRQSSFDHFVPATLLPTSASKQLVIKTISTSSLHQTTLLDASTSFPVTVPTVVAPVTPEERPRPCSAGALEAPNPRPVIRYSQGQLQFIDRQYGALTGITVGSVTDSGITPTSIVSQHSLGERSPSLQEHGSYNSVSPVERIDILETI